MCGYSQRIQRPEFVRRTKHSSIGHEDIGYSYVVIQRGLRPRPSVTGLGRVGAVGKWALERAARKMPARELRVDDEPDESPQPLDPGNCKLSLIAQSDEGFSEEEVREALRLEAYQWPRLVFPPLKKSGHIILDGCTAEGTLISLHMGFPVADVFR